jgi:hyperosmotically inducible protein
VSGCGICRGARRTHSWKDVMMTAGRHLRIILAAAMLASAGACSAMNGQETAGQYVDDATISTKVRANLVKDQALKASEIKVNTLNRVVQLSGFVDSPEQKQRAEQIALSVDGVSEVKNDIIVRG